MKILTNGQFYAIMVITAFFNIMCMQGSFSQNQILGTLLAGGIEMVFVIFMVYLYRNKTLENIFKSKAVNILYKTVLVIYAFSGLFKLFGIMEAMNFNISLIFGSILMIAVCLYCASLGFKTLARSSIAVTAFIAVSLAVMIFGAYDKADLSLLTKSSDDMRVIEYTFSAFSGSSELILLPSLLLLTSRDSSKPAIWYVLTKAALIVFISVLGITLLGDNNLTDKYPFFLIGAISQPFSVQRADGIYMVLFTLVCGMNIITAESLRRHIK